MNRLVFLLIVVIASSSTSPAPASTGSDVVPFAIQVPLVLKALTYDRSLKSRVGGEVRIAVLSPPGKAARETVDELTASLDGLPARSLDGLPVRFVEVAADEESLDRALRGGRWAAAYAMPGFADREMQQLRRVCESAHVLLVGAASGDVERGMAFGVGAQGGKPVMVVNLSVARACGSEFDLALLRLARVIQ
jgi:hypothetical protein